MSNQESKFIPQSLYELNVAKSTTHKPLNVMLSTLKFRAV